MNHLGIRKRHFAACFISKVTYTSNYPTLGYILKKIHMHHTALL